MSPENCSFDLFSYRCDVESKWRGEQNDLGNDALSRFESASVILVVAWVCLQKIVLSIYFVKGRTRRGKKEETAESCGKNC